MHKLTALTLGISLAASAFAADTAAPAKPTDGAPKVVKKEEPKNATYTDAAKAGVDRHQCRSRWIQSFECAQPTTPRHHLGDDRRVKSAGVGQ